MRKYADLLLDTPVYNAHTSAGDAIWAGSFRAIRTDIACHCDHTTSGVPIITKLGDTMPSRVCGSMVLAAGFPDMIVSDFKEYEERAVSNHRHAHTHIEEREKRERERERLCMLCTD
jgi:predicted O-linked N-acetylglucosamine transferase (SPINDLY family)